MFKFGQKQEWSRQHQDRWIHFIKGFHISRLLFLLCWICFMGDSISCFISLWRKNLAMTNALFITLKMFVICNEWWIVEVIVWWLRCSITYYTRMKIPNVIGDYLWWVCLWPYHSFQLIVDGIEYSSSCFYFCRNVLSLKDPSCAWLYHFGIWSPSCELALSSYPYK